MHTLPSGRLWVPRGREGTDFKKDIGRYKGDTFTYQFAKWKREIHKELSPTEVDYTESGRRGGVYVQAGTQRAIVYI